MNLILDFAKTDDRILAAYLKGSRTNPNVPLDIYRDFDIMYVVTETCSFIHDTSWMKHFGTVMLMQEQDTDFGYGERFQIRKAIMTRAIRGCCYLTTETGSTWVLRRFR